MGIFYIDNSDNELKSNQIAHKSEIKELAERSLKIAEKSSNEIFPEFLWDPKLNEFENDDYRLRGTCTNPNVLKAYRIRRKYTNYWDYLEALEVYYDYVDYIDSAYGSFDMIKNAADNGMSVVYVPRKPKLSNKKKNKLLIQTGFVPSRVNPEFEEENDELLTLMLENLEKRELSFDEDYKLPKIDRKIRKKVYETEIEQKRVSNVYAYQGNPTGHATDAIINFLTSPNNENNMMRYKKESFTEQMMHINDDDYIPEHVKENEIGPITGFIREGFYVQSKEDKIIEILKVLESEGYDFLKSSITKNLDKRAIRAIEKKRMQEIDYSELTPKQIKKLKKKEAKRRKLKHEKNIGDQRIYDALLGNRTGYHRELGFDFTISSIYDD